MISYAAVAAAGFLALALTAVFLRLRYRWRRFRLMALLYCLLIILYIRPVFRFGVRYYDNWPRPIQYLFVADTCARAPVRMSHDENRGGKEEQTPGHAARTPRGHTG